MTEETSKPLAEQEKFNLMLGMFHANWSTVDLTTDYAICQFLKITPGESHLITSGMMFGRKARLLVGLIGRSDHPNKAAILGAFNKIRAVKRDVITHSYIRSNKESVTFLERSSGGEFRAIEHRFTFPQFFELVSDLAKNGTHFFNLLGATKEDVGRFATAALSLSRKSKTSPGKPTRKR